MWAGEIDSTDLAGKRIVVVEDDEASLYAVEHLLKSAGCEAVSYSDNKGALTEIESNQPVDLLET